MTSSYALSLLERIKKKNKKQLVTVDSLIDQKTYKASEKIVNAIKELRDEGLINCISIQDHGKFATEITGFEGYVKHDSVPDILRKEYDEEEGSVEVVIKKKRIKRNVKRGVV
jgi:hypothetical protein